MSIFKDSDASQHGVLQILKTYRFLLCMGEDIQGASSATALFKTHTNTVLNTLDKTTLIDGFESMDLRNSNSSLKTVKNKKLALGLFKYGEFSEDGKKCQLKDVDKESLSHDELEEYILVENYLEDLSNKNINKAQSKSEWDTFMLREGLSYTKEDLIQPIIYDDIENLDQKLINYDDTNAKSPEECYLIKDKKTVRFYVPSFEHMSQIITLHNNGHIDQNITPQFVISTDAIGIPKNLTAEGVKEYVGLYFESRKYFSDLEIPFIENNKLDLASHFTSEGRSLMQLKKEENPNITLKEFLDSDEVTSNPELYITRKLLRFYAVRNELNFITFCTSYEIKPYLDEYLTEDGLESFNLAPYTVNQVSDSLEVKEEEFILPKGARIARHGDDVTLEYESTSGYYYSIVYSIPQRFYQLKTYKNCDVVNYEPLGHIDPVELIQYIESEKDIEVLEYMKEYCPLYKEELPIIFEAISRRISQL